MDWCGDYVTINFSTETYDVGTQNSFVHPKQMFKLIAKHIYNFTIVFVYLDLCYVIKI